MNPIYCVVCTREINLEEPGHPFHGRALPLGDGIHPLCEKRVQTWDEDTAHEDWRKLFHSPDDLIFAEPIKWAIEGMLQEGGITAIGGLPGHGKSLIAMAMAQALLSGEPLFDCFQVAKKAPRVIYLCPEVAVVQMATRIRLFGLTEYVIDDRLLVRSLSLGNLRLDDALLLKAVQDADIFLDTAIRFENGVVDENAAGQMKHLTDACFKLINAGARSVVALHHSPKGLSGPEDIDTETVLRGSGEFAAGLTGCWGIYQIDKGTNKIYLANTKARDSQPCEPLIIEGRPYLDTNARFNLLAEPGQAKAYREASRNRSTGQVDNIAKYKRAGMSVRAIANEVGLSKSTVHEVLRRSDVADPNHTGGSQEPL